MRISDWSSDGCSSDLESLVQGKVDEAVDHICAAFVLLGACGSVAVAAEAGFLQFGFQREAALGNDRVTFAESGRHLGHLWIAQTKRHLAPLKPAFASSHKHDRFVFMALDFRCDRKSAV